MAASKRRKAAHEKLEAGKAYDINDALDLVKQLATAKFPESIDVSVNLGVDPRKSDQVVRGSTVLPNGTGKTVRVAVFTQGENAEKALAAGADVPAKFIENALPSLRPQPTKRRVKPGLT